MLCLATHRSFPRDTFILFLVVVNCSAFHGGTCEGRHLGHDGFAEEVLSKFNERDHRLLVIPAMIAAVCTLYGLTPEALRAPGKTRPASENRALVALRAREASHLSLIELGFYLDRDLAALSQAARRLAAEKADNSGLSARNDALHRMVLKV